jgi:hypothetical protein
LLAWRGIQAAVLSLAAGGPARWTPMGRQNTTIVAQLSGIAQRLRAASRAWAGVDI